MSTDQAPNAALSTTLATWRTGRHPSLPIIAQLIDAGLDVDLIAHQHSSGVIPLPFGVKPAMSTTAEVLNLPITYLEDAPRVLDTDLGQALGMAKPEDIRRTINANRQELEELGVIALTAITSTDKGGRPGTAFYLNEEQATYVTMHAKTPKAREAKLLVVRVFTAWRRGEVHSAAAEPRPAIPEAQREAPTARRKRAAPQAELESGGPALQKEDGLGVPLGQAPAERSRTSPERFQNNGLAFRNGRWFYV